MARKPAIGRLDKRITLQRPTVHDAGGGSGQAATDFADFPTSPTVWARVESVSGGAEFNESGQLQPKSMWTVTIRRRQDITTKDRVLYGSRVLYISAITDDATRSEFLELSCTEYPA